jgi:hypothetical protein
MITKNDTKMGQKDLTKAGSDDGYKQTLRNLCFDAVRVSFQESQGFGGNGAIDYVYDNRKNLFTNAPIQSQVFSAFT